MLRFAITQLWSRRRRLVGTGLAIVIGVAFLSGTLVLGDTLSANFDRLFTNVSAGTDVVVRNAVNTNPGAIVDPRGPIPASLVDQVRAVPGVAAAEGQVAGLGTLLGSDGKPVGGIGPPRQAGSWITDPVLNPYRLVDGRAPRADDEVVINRGAAKAGDLHLGQTTTVLTPDPVRVTVVGIATFGNADGFGQATWTAFTLAGAQAHVLGRPNAIDTVVVRAQPGVTSTTLRNRISAVLPSGTQAITGQQLAQEQIDAVSKQFLNLLRTFLTAFALVAMLVGAITIANSFSITVAQRTRELAVLRVVGASSRQVRRSVTAEAVVLGSVCSAVGLVAGLGIAELLKGLFDAIGFGLPAGGLTIEPAAAIEAFAAGLVATVVAVQGAARRAGRVAPLAALRDAEAGVDVPSRPRTALGCGGLVLGLALGVTGALSGRAALVGLGALLVLIGALVAAPAVVPVAAAAGGWLTRRTFRADADLAAGGMRRHPRRTASTATALIVGVAIVTLCTVFAASLQSSIRTSVQGSVRADLVIETATFGGGRVSTAALPILEAMPETGAVVGQAPANLLVDGHGTLVTATSLRDVERVLDLSVHAGSFDRATSTSVAVSASEASSHQWQVGSPVRLTFADGHAVTAQVAVVYGDDDLAGSMLVPLDTWMAHTDQPALQSVLLTASPGTSTAALRAAVTPVADRYGADVDDPAQLAATSASALDMLLNVVYVLLALAIVVALLGIANALSLAVHERRHEIGFLRAVGQTRRQVRRTLRLEAAMTAAFATLMGLAVGTFLGWSLFAAVATTPGFTVPVARLAVVAVVGAGAGVLAAIRPARRAARLPVLEAMAAPS